MKTDAGEGLVDAGIREHSVQGERSEVLTDLGKSFVNGPYDGDVYVGKGCPGTLATSEPDPRGG